MKKKTRRVKIILMADIKSLGKKGELKTVLASYARNYLFPEQMAIIATVDKIAFMEKKLAQEKAKLEAQEHQTKEKLAKLSAQVFTFNHLSAQESKLYGSIGKKEIIEKIQKSAKIKLSANQINLDKPLKQKGEFEIFFNLTPQVQGKFKVIIK